MYTSKTMSLTFLLTFMLFISSTTHILGCGYCDDPSPKHKPKPKPKPKHKPTKPPAVVLPPISVPPVEPVPPVVGPPTGPIGGKPGPGPNPKETCPIDALKLGACVDVLGGLIHIGLGDPIKNQCCPILNGLVELEAAVCLCTTLKLKLLNLNLYVPLALQLLLTCGKAPPPGFTCTL
ncbi:hypothetical protein RND81_07G111300 [Saponaria officinalis]|uniref:Bifunctional inhibitor/plant lipid transfer protein/seed storage helical domain-containing protein n=1 Tax=Saponaria officinalis TaxID=3572 RepID=A0AAW1JTW5_SAPOF